MIQSPAHSFYFADFQQKESELIKDIQGLLALQSSAEGENGKEGARMSRSLEGCYLKICTTHCPNMFKYHVGNYQEILKQLSKKKILSLEKLSPAFSIVQRLSRISRALELKTPEKNSPPVNGEEDGRKTIEKMIRQKEEKLAASFFQSLPIVYSSLGKKVCKGEAKPKGVSREEGARILSDDLPAIYAKAISNLSKILDKHIQNKKMINTILQKIFAEATQQFQDLFYNPGNLDKTTTKKTASTIAVRCRLIFSNSVWDSKIFKKINTLTTNMLLQMGDWKTLPTIKTMDTKTLVDFFKKFSIHFNQQEVAFTNSAEKPAQLTLDCFAEDLVYPSRLLRFGPGNLPLWQELMENFIIAHKNSLEKDPLPAVVDIRILLSKRAEKSALLDGFIAACDQVFLANPNSNIRTTTPPDQPSTEIQKLLNNLQPSKDQLYEGIAIYDAHLSFRVCHIPATIYLSYTLWKWSMRAKRTKSIDSFNKQTANMLRNVNEKNNVSLKTLYEQRKKDFEHYLNHFVRLEKYARLSVFFLSNYLKDAPLSATIQQEIQDLAKRPVFYLEMSFEEATKKVLFSEKKAGLPALETGAGFKKNCQQHAKTLFESWDAEMKRSS